MMSSDLDRNHPLSMAMWAGFVNWAISEEPIRREFEESTGFPRLSIPKNALEAMIDEATGIHDDYLKTFVRYITENYWGLEYVPDIYFDKFAEVK